ncbi:hypothetical protein RSAG8_08007, partial [Rhizoctonia solani AG-8 WAC10335]
NNNGNVGDESAIRPQLGAYNLLSLSHPGHTERLVESSCLVKRSCRVSFVRRDFLDRARVVG